MTLRGSVSFSLEDAGVLSKTLFGALSASVLEVGEGVASTLGAGERPSRRSIGSSAESDSFS